MSEPIPVKEALRLIEMALEDERRAHVGPWTQSWAESKTTPENAAFIVLARATMRPMLNMAWWLVRHTTNPNIGIEPNDGTRLHAVLAALRDHYTRTRPGWRKS